MYRVDYSFGYYNKNNHLVKYWFSKTFDKFDDASLMMTFIAKNFKFIIPDYARTDTFECCLISLEDDGCFVENEIIDEYSGKKIREKIESDPMYEEIKDFSRIYKRIYSE